MKGCCFQIERSLGSHLFLSFGFHAARTVRLLRDCHRRLLSGCSRRLCTNLTTTLPPGRLNAGSRGNGGPVLALRVFRLGKRQLYLFTTTYQLLMARTTKTESEQ